MGGSAACQGGGALRGIPGEPRNLGLCGCGTCCREAERQARLQEARDLDEAIRQFQADEEARLQREAAKAAQRMALNK